MPAGSSPDMLVVVDADPASEAGLRIASEYARGTVALTAWEVPELEVEAEAIASVASEPTVDEALRIAAQRGIAWVALRRDFAEPATLLGELLVATGRQTDDDLSGFAVFLADGDPTPFRRILAIVDHTTGPVSGLVAHAAVAVAASADAILDVLVIGPEGQQVAAEDEQGLLAVSREQELFDGAVERLRDSGIRVNWLPVTEVTEPWWVIRDQLAQHDYDLVIDDLGDVALGGRLGLERTIEGALAPGQVGEIPLRLLSETDRPLLLVLDEIKLGIAPLRLLKAGTVAAMSLGIVAGAALSAASPTVAAQSRNKVDDAVAPDEPDTVATDEIAVELEEALGLTPQRQDDAVVTSRSAARATARTASRRNEATVVSSAEDEAVKVTKEKTLETASQEPPKAPSGGASPADVAKAQRQAAKTEAALDKSKAKRTKAKEKLAEAQEVLKTAQAGAQVALSELEAATLSLTEATNYAEAASSDATGLTGVLPGGISQEQASLAREAERLAQERLDRATTAGSEALETLAEAHDEVADAEAALDRRKEVTSQTKAELEAAQAKLAVYKASLAQSRQAPVAKGNYHLTARFGQAGWYWSSGVHTGLDFAGKTGTNVMAAASGKVVEVGWAGAYGNRIVIDHGNGYTTTYNHLSGTRVSLGERVQTGDHIGEMGTTGNSTGTHLHFEVLKGKKFLDPEAWLGW